MKYMITGGEMRGESDSLDVDELMLVGLSRMSSC